MAKTDTSEWGLESLIVAQMCERGWIPGDPADYNREYAVDLRQLYEFLQATQPDALPLLDLENENSPTRRQFLARLQGEISKRGTIDVLRKGISHGRISRLDLFYGTPSAGNPKAIALNAQNRFSVTRQLRYSRDETQRALDLCLFINGLPVMTFELKNSLTKQTVEDAVQQYKRDRNPLHELLFQFGRCVVHFAVDDQETRMCTHIKGTASWFLPFNQGWNDGAGNPPNPEGIKTDYLWTRVLTPPSLTNILENYAQITEKKDKKAKKKKREQVFPRYHQLEVVRLLLADATRRGAGKHTMPVAPALLPARISMCHVIFPNNLMNALVRNSKFDGKIGLRFTSLIFLANYSVALGFGEVLRRLVIDVQQLQETGSSNGCLVQTSSVLCLVDPYGAK